MLLSFSKKSSKRLRDELSQAAYFFACQLEIDQSEVIVEINIDKNIEYAGLASCEDEDHFIIDINPDHCEQTFVTLAHEMVHVAQWLRGDLDMVSRQWKGKRYDDCPYEQLPWEIEAHVQEKKLFEAWVAC